MSKTLIKPLYDIHKTYLENAEDGPFFDGEIPKRPQTNTRFDFLGFKIASPIGVPAGPLLNSKWIGLAADLGFDVLCYKTIRSREHLGHPLPNVIFVNAPDQLDPKHLPEHLIAKESISEKIAITNSFGMPSRSREYLKQDIPLSNRKLHPGQVMIVSVVGSPDDFIETACFAKECGAQIIEANFSCPNVKTGEGDIACNSDSVFEIASGLVKALNSTPLIIKIGIFPNKKLLQNTLVAAARAGVQAVSGINTISMKVLDTQGKPALGPNRLTSGICGNPIRNAALEFVRDARDIINKERLGLSLLACGGITQTDHFQDFLNSGADIAMTATGMMWDPYIAMRYHEQKTNHSKPI